MDSGVKELKIGLENTNCKLETLRLSNCSITEEGYKALASALRSNPSHLIELDLRGNDPGQSGVKELNVVLQDQYNSLKSLRFLSPDAEKACQYVNRVVGKNPLFLNELNLSEHKLGDTNVEYLAALLKDKHCQINTLTLFNCSITEKQCFILTSALKSNPSHLRELNLSGNKLGDSGVKNLSDLLMNSQCKLEKLQLNNNGITGDGCAALTSALISNPSNLMELDLSGNKLGNSGMENICLLLANAQCTLKKLKLSDCSISEEGYKALASALESNPSSQQIELDLRGNYPGQSGLKWLFKLLGGGMTISYLRSPAAKEACDYLTKVLGTNPLQLQELDLSRIELGDMDWENISALLVDSHCTVGKIKLNNCELTKKCCSVLATVLSKNNNLKELNLNNSRLLESGVKQICEGLKKPVCELEILKLSGCSITEEGYKALASALRSNPSHLIELDLTGNDPGQSGVKQFSDLLQNQKCSLKTLRFLQGPAAEACQYLTGVLKNNPLILRDLNLSGHKLGDTGVNQLAILLQDKHCKPIKLTLRDCGLTEKSCSALASVLRSNSSLKELDISNNNLMDSGVKELKIGLENTNCKLEKLGLSNCSVTEEGYKALASALRSNPSSLLIELDLRGNDPGQSGVKELHNVPQKPGRKLTLRFLSPAADEACQYVNRVVGKNPLFLNELNLSERELGDSNVEYLAALLKDKHCQFNTLTLNNNGITADGCSALTSALISNPSNLMELDLSGNTLGHSGMENICLLLANPHCTLKKLKLSECSISEEDYKALASALESNPSSQQIELDLRGNYPGQSGLKWLFKLLGGGMTISYLQSPAAKEACDYLTKVLGTNPLQLQELDLSRIKPGDMDWENISALLVDSHCTVRKIKLNNCELTKKSCSVLATVLSKNNNLKELNLNNSRLLDSGVKQICEGLKKPVCELEILKLSGCSITEEGYKALASALRSNPSHLIELDLTGNDPGQSGVKQFSDLLQNQKCSLKTLRFLQGPAAEACQYLTGVLENNPLFLRDLNLSGHKLGDTGVNQLAILLQDKHCKPIKLTLRDCGLTEKSCSALATVLRSNSSLKELDISNNNLMDSGVKELKIGLENTNCKLETLRLSNCSITEEGYKALASALRSNPSHLIELDLRGNDPGQSGVKELSVVLQDQYNSLKSLRFLSPDAEKACQYVNRVVGQNPLLLNELNLSEHKLGDTNVEYLAALLKDKHCQFNTLTLFNCSITEHQCIILTSALKSNPSHLRELNLSGNNLGDSGVKNLSDLLMNSQCKLEKLHLCGCSITEKQCFILTSALNSNPSHLRQLELSGNKLGDSGVQNLSDPLMQCELEMLDLSGCSITEELCVILTSALKSNPSHLRELNLSGNELKNTGLNRLCDILENSHCKLERLSLNECGITDVSSLTQYLTKTKPLQCLKELDLSNNEIGKSKDQLSKALKDTNCKLRLDSKSLLKQAGGWIKSWFSSEKPVK